MSLEINRAKQILNADGVVGMPTETVYGLAARIDRPEALKKIFSTKKRPFFDPLIIHVAKIEDAKKLTDQWGSTAQVLCEKFWPGPLTIILPKAKDINPIITSGLDTVGLRCPAHPIARKLIEEVGVPLAAPSANRFGHTSPTTAIHVRTELPDIYVVDGGPCQVGIESTILHIKGDGPSQLSILRKGFITKTQIELLLNLKKIQYQWIDNDKQISSPGQLQHHYMPDVPLVYLAKKLDPLQIKDVVRRQVAKLPTSIEGVELKKPSENLDKIYELEFSPEAEISARELYQKLRTASEQKPDLILFRKQPWHEGEVWSAFLDRLYRAATIRIE